MHPDLLDILQNQQLPITDEQLVDYLTGKLSDEECHNVEKKLAASGLDDEAFEGLMLVNDKTKIRQHALDINKSLLEKLKNQKQNKRQKAKILQINWLIILAVGLLCLIFLAWFVIHKMKG